MSKIPDITETEEWIVKTTLKERYGSDPAKIVEGMIGDTIEEMYSTSDENKFLEVTHAKGEREVFYFKDFVSGAMIENIEVDP